MWETWNDVFRLILGPAERGFVGELRGHRNRWAHQEAFSGDDAYRALDTAHRLLTAVSAAQAADVEKLKMELLRVRFDEQARGARRKQAGLAIEGAAGTLKPWREVVTPHQDVASGRYQQAEFAADLWQAHLGEGPASTAPGRVLPAHVSDREPQGDAHRRGAAAHGRRRRPGRALQTNFGGGKTHSMLALYHLCSGVAPRSWPASTRAAGRRRAGAAEDEQARGSGGQPHLAGQSGHQGRRHGRAHVAGWQIRRAHRQGRRARHQPGRRPSAASD